jgi:hypothetical protein
VRVEPKTKVNCWCKIGILPAKDVEVVEHSSGMMTDSKSATPLTEFAGSAVMAAVSELMEAQEFLDVIGDVPTEAAHEEVDAGPSDGSSEKEGTTKISHP